jgi:hypothetical protein
MRSLMAGLLVLVIAFAARGEGDDARAFLERWRDAQNGGDFAAYRALYDETFSGVRRSGDKVVRLDRKGWLDERVRMFRRPMTVEIDGPRVYTGKEETRIAFTQRWASGGYADEGPKVLVLRRRGGAYRIVGEELLSSRRSVDPPGAFEQLAPVIAGELVLSTAPDESWAAGPPRLTGSQVMYETERPVAREKLPAALRALPGRRFRLMSASGPLCEATADRLLLRSRVGLESVESPAEAWDRGAKRLVATLAGGCAGATWARAASLPPLALIPAKAPDAPLGRRAVAAFRALPEAQAFRREQRAWASRHEEDRTTDWLPGAVVRVMAPAGGGPTLLSVSAETANLCNEPQLTMWALWEVEASGTLRLLNRPSQRRHLVPTAAVDLDGDGRPALLFDSFTDYEAGNATGQPQRIEPGLTRAASGYLHFEGVELPVYICPC